MTPGLVAVLYQALPPPLIDGLRKAAKPGGYSDGGADIGFALASRGHRLATPAPRPDPARAMDWVFPDTPEGLRAALEGGAEVIWANTVVFAGHPVEDLPPGVLVVGQTPADVQRFDQKFETNAHLAAAGLAVARSVLVARRGGPGVLALDALSTDVLGANGLALPLMVKPVRGRGSQGVSRAATVDDLVAALAALIDDGAFGDTAMVETYLGGEEMTVTVMPPGAPRPSGERSDRHWALRPVLRFDQHDGVAPYNGDVPVTANSAAIPAARMAEPEVQAMCEACVRAAEVVRARALIRIDCRADGDGRFHIFDLNMKPNMTGPGRPGRDGQDCLSAIAATADGWSYPELIEAMLAAGWRARTK